MPEIKQHLPNTGKVSFRFSKEHRMHTVAQILQTKQDRTIYTIAPAALILDALRLMAEKNVGALLVMEDRKIAGIVTERDYARKVILMGRSSSNTPVSDIM